MSRCTTPDFSFPLSPEQELLRYNSPESYPCYTECGWYRSISGYKALCCCTPKVTPDGEDGLAKVVGCRRRPHQGSGCLCTNGAAKVRRYGAMEPMEPW